MKKKWLLFIPLAVFGLLTGLFVFGLQNDPTKLPSALVGKPFPEFQLNQLEAGKTVSKLDIQGPALINVWATWCPTCRVEHKALMKLADMGVNIYGINYKDERGAANQWLNQLGDPYAVNIFDPDGKLGFDLGVYGAPETFLIDKEGVIRYRHAGEMTVKFWQETLQPLIAGGKS